MTAGKRPGGAARPSSSPRPGGRQAAGGTRTPGGPRASGRKAAGRQASGRQATGRQAAGRHSAEPPAARGANRSRRPPAGTAWWQRPWLVPAAVAGIAVVVLGLVLLGRGTSDSGVTAQPASASLIQQVTTVPAATLVAAGDGGVSQPFEKVSGRQPLTGPSGRPQLLYIGADWCPFCAAQRWSIVVALSRFGTVGGLYTTTSSSSDTYPDTHTLSFAHLTYSSSVLDVSAVELADRTRTALQTPTAAQQQLMDALDAPPYTQTSGAIPFLDIGNQYVAISSGYSPDVLAGKDWTQIATALQDSTSPIARAILGNANRITAAICTATGNLPASVCAAAPITTLETQLPTQSP